MRRGPDTGALLGRALARSAEISGATVEVDSCDTRPWFSATLSGARHAVAITAPAGDAVTRWLRSLPQQSLPLSGHLVADLTVAQAVEHAGRLNLRIDALTVAAA